jgi:hypothetical protein
MSSLCLHILAEGWRGGGRPTLHLTIMTTFSCPSSLRRSTITLVSALHLRSLTGKAFLVWSSIPKQYFLVTYFESALGETALILMDSGIDQLPMLRYDFWWEGKKVCYDT